MGQMNMAMLVTAVPGLFLPPRKRRDGEARGRRVPPAGIVLWQCQTLGTTGGMATL